MKFNLKLKNKKSIHILHQNSYPNKQQKKRSIRKVKPSHTLEKIFLRTPNLTTTPKLNGTNFNG